MKHCKKCEQTKELKEFSKSGNGTRNQCKECMRAWNKEYRQANAEQEKLRSKIWYDANKEYFTQWRGKNADRLRELAECNKEQLAEYNKFYREQNKESIAQQRHSAYEQNKEEIIAKVQAWRIKNPEKRKAQEHRRRYLKINNTQPGKHYTAKEFIELCEIYNYTCLACGAEDLPMTVDHIVPLAKNGSNSIDNIQPLCMPCNAKKHTSIVDYRKAHELCLT